MRVLALSDLHLHYQENLQALEDLPEHPEDWLLLAGDVGHDAALLRAALERLCPRFARVVWTPGNHELWSLPGASDAAQGEAKYLQLVSLCREHGVLTPEDPYPSLTIAAQTFTLAPLFLLYDYSFRPDGLTVADALLRAAEAGIMCLDEVYLAPAPFPSRAAWCAARCALTRERLAAVPAGHQLVLINHFPLRQDLIHISIPTFTPWCGTRLTEEWHRRFPVAVVVSGHLHVRLTEWRDGVRFEEVSLGYPRQWRRERGIEGYLRQILPLTPRGTDDFVYHR